MFYLRIIISKHHGLLQSVKVFETNIIQHTNRQKKMTMSEIINNLIFIDFVTQVTSLVLKM